MYKKLELREDRTGNSILVSWQIASHSVRILIP